MNTHLENSLIAVKHPLFPIWDTTDNTVRVCHDWQAILQNEMCHLSRFPRPIDIYYLNGSIPLWVDQRNNDIEMKGPTRIYQHVIRASATWRDLLHHASKYTIDDKCQFR